MATASHASQTRSCHLDEPGSLCKSRVPNSSTRSTIAAPAPIHGNRTIATSVQLLCIEAPLRGNYYAVVCWTGTGRSNSGLKNRLSRAAKIIGAKPITAAKTSRPVLPITPFLYNR